VKAVEMTEYADLTFFRYTPSPWAFKTGFPYLLVNIGWLGSRVPTPHRAFTDEEKLSILYNLGEFMKYEVNVQRGVHQCEICGFDPEPGVVDGLSCGGHGEIFVPGVNNLVYVAPTLIYHYIKHDGYVPPEEFIEAVRNVGSMDAYRRFYDLSEASG
jgi:hypothetical protein